MMGSLFAELRHRVITKLEYGERVIVDAPNLRREDRLGVARLGLSAGVPVFYLICPDDTGGVETEAMSGEGVAEVVDARKATLVPVAKGQPDLDAIRARWAGITVMGDVHGMHQSMLSAISWADSRNHYLVFLGDVIDYGHGTLDASDEAYRRVMRGSATMILGNHERKISRWIAAVERNGRGEGVRLSDGNRVTTDRLAELSHVDRNRWQGRFRGLVAHAVPWRAFGDIVVAHASVHPGLWNNTASRREIEDYATYGEFEAGVEGSGSRSYSWVDHIPETKTAIVGHDIRSTAAPFTQVNAQGSSGIFLDTGCGKSGPLSSVDLRFGPEGELRVENFNMH
jgi:protein phosphatase